MDRYGACSFVRHRHGLTHSRSKRLLSRLELDALQHGSRWGSKRESGTMDQTLQQTAEALALALGEIKRDPILELFGHEVDHVADFK